MSEEKKDKPLDAIDIESTSSGISTARDMVDLEEGDDVLAMKMKLVNDALDKIGFTWFHFSYMIIAGYGYAAESLLGFSQSTVATWVGYQFNVLFPITTEMIYAGYLVGCIVLGFSADIIGRKVIFNSSLLLSSIFAFGVGGSSSFPMYCVMLFLSSVAVGSNLAIDSTVFLETLPSKYQFLTTLFACFWAIGQAVAYAVAYGFSGDRFHCDSVEECDFKDNRGWRYIWYTDAAIVLFFALVRLLLRLEESPKYLVSNNRDEEAYLLLKKIATKYNRPFDLTLEELQDCGVVQKNDFNENKSVKVFLRQCGTNIKSLFKTKKMTLNIILLFLSWGLIGLSYPLYSVFLPSYLAAKGADTSAGTTAGVYRDSLIANSLSFFGPVIGGGLILVPKIGCRGTLCIGGVLTMVFLFAYTSVRTHAQSLAFSVVSYITIYIYYGCLYAYTPLVLPSYCRATGTSLSFVVNRFVSLFVPVVAYYADTTTSVPIYVCAAVVGLIGIMALFFPFEPARQRAV